MLRTQSASQHNGLPVPAINPKVAGIPFLKIALGAIMLFVQACPAADTHVTAEQKKIVRDQRAGLKTEVLTISRAVASDQKTACRREFSESLAEALAKTKEQRRKLLLEVVESSIRRPKRGL